MRNTSLSYLRNPNFVGQCLGVRLEAEHINELAGLVILKLVLSDKYPPS